MTHREMFGEARWIMPPGSPDAALFRKCFRVCDPQNAQITIRPGVDAFPVVKFKDKRGYIYKHPKMHAFKDMLVDLEVYDDYRNTLARHGVLFYLTGLECIDIGVAHSIMRDIEKRFKRGDLSGWLR